ncbi:MAG: histidine phosphatase family protein [Actinobacteria bacterium]|nr:MAG: histidine phosphatase family protein [Actinomycetota bacterium]
MRHVEIVLVRHALPLRVELETGIADPELAAEGREQATKLAAYLGVEDVEAVYVSPLRRALETANPLCKVLGLEAVVSEGVAEFDRNSREYVPVEELRATNDPRWEKLLRGEWDGVDEDPSVFKARVVASVEEIIDRHPGGRVVVVCHGGVINQYLAHVLGIETQVGFFYPKYTSIHRVMAARSGERSIVSINEAAHLR